MADLVTPDLYMQGYRSSLSLHKEVPPPLQRHAGIYEQMDNSDDESYPPLEDEQQA
jgi:hypothetical protein